MSAAQLTKAMEKASTESSKITQMMIDAGRGYEYPSDMMKKSDPLSLKYQKSASLLQDLYAEKNRRMTYSGTMRPIKYQENPTMTTKKFSPAQIAAQKLFSERARAGTLGKTAKRKTNPDKSKPRAYVMRASQATGRPPVKGTKAGNRLITRRKKALSAPAGYFPNPSTNTGLAIYLDAIAQGDTYSESKLMEALEHPALSASDRTVIRAAIKGTPYSHTELHYAAMKIRNYTGGQPKYSAAAVNKAIASSRSKISASEGKTIHKLLKGRHGNPTATMMTGYQVIGMLPKKNVVGIFKTMARAKNIATFMADANGVPYGVKTVKVHKAHFAV